MALESHHPVELRGEQKPRPGSKDQKREQLQEADEVMNKSNLKRSCDLPGGTQPAPGNARGRNPKELHPDLLLSPP